MYDSSLFFMLKACKDKIESLESRIDVLIQENTQLREKLARVEERLILNAKKKVNSRRKNA